MKRCTCGKRAALLCVNKKCYTCCPGGDCNYHRRYKKNRSKCNANKKLRLKTVSLTTNNNKAQGDIPLKFVQFIMAAAANKSGSAAAAAAAAVVGKVVKGDNNNVNDILDYSQQRELNALIGMMSEQNKLRDYKFKLVIEKINVEKDSD